MRQQLMIFVVNINGRTKGGVTAIYDAIVRNQNEAVKLLHDTGAELAIGDRHLRVSDGAFETNIAEINLRIFQINLPYGERLGNLRLYETPIKVVIGDYEPLPWLIRMLCKTGAELNEAGIFTWPLKPKYLTKSYGISEQICDHDQTVLDHALERVEEAKSHNIMEITEEVCWRIRRADCVV